MTKNPKIKSKKGAASFYIVAFSTLILVILAMSFVAVIVSEASRTSNDDLAQSAYDSALAGIEDAKLAYYNYQSCIESKADFRNAKVTVDGKVSCEDIVAWVRNPDETKENMKKCDIVGHILGRIPDGQSGDAVMSDGSSAGGYMIQETKNSGNNMQQAVTCASIDIRTNDYRTTLSGEDSTRVVQVKLKDKDVNNITHIKVSWYSNTDGSDYQFTNFKDSKVVFPTHSTKLATPPTISFGIAQTDTVFNLSEFDLVNGNTTNRGTVFLVPTDNSERAAGKNVPDNYIGAYSSSTKINSISAAQMAKSNDRTVKNLPYAVYCNKDVGEFACNATIELPSPISHFGGNATRNKDTFMVIVSIPYGQPSTDVALEFCDTAGCAKRQSIGGELTEISSAVDLDSMQVVVDSTGRANDIYRRIEARVETSDVYFPFPLYAIELLGKGSGKNLEKDSYVTCEYQSWGGDNFPTCGNE